ncbi:ArsR/SmtB family transcription factor [Frateuria defendens]|uniref:ArsR/SmtB family transcription factor n=1 Tax=Frateuria defendens TaxID=2219559 RepID=UPI00066FB9F8|nr:winged helix-turn-helix domain-containing protein [Frateuria defendens]
MQTKQAIAILAALAQESRLAVYRLLIEHAPDGLAASAIAERLGLANATLSFHLKELQHAGLIVGRQQGRFIYYAPVLDTMDALVGFLTENCCGGSGASCATPRACAPATQRASTKTRAAEPAPRTRRAARAIER